MKIDHPHFSIIIPTYQRRDLVCETVRSLARLKYAGAVEIIVVADGCTDGTAAALRAIECPFPLQVIEQPNSGAGAARNRGASRASGDALLFLDDDMIAAPDMLEQHARSYSAGADAVVGAFTEPGSSNLIGAIEGRAADDGGEEATNPFGLFGGHISVRRSAFEDVGRFDESFTQDGQYGYEDFDLAHRLLQRFSVRRNSRAITHHLKSIGARQYIRRARSCAGAEVRLIGKYPELRRELLEWTGAARVSTRVRLLSRIPVFPGLIAEVAAMVVEVGARTPFRSARKLGQLRQLAYTLAYWSTVERIGGIPDC